MAFFPDIGGFPICMLLQQLGTPQATQSDVWSIIKVSRNPAYQTTTSTIASTITTTTSSSALPTSSVDKSSADDYVLTFTGLVDGIEPADARVFASALNPALVLYTGPMELTQCFFLCHSVGPCRGVHVYTDQSRQMCALLQEAGEGVSTTIAGYSYTKKSRSVSTTQIQTTASTTTTTATTASTTSTAPPSTTSLTAFELEPGYRVIYRGTASFGAGKPGLVFAGAKNSNHWLFSGGATLDRCYALCDAVILCKGIAWIPAENGQDQFCLVLAELGEGVGTKSSVISLAKVSRNPELITTPQPSTTTITDRHTTTTTPATTASATTKTPTASFTTTSGWETTAEADTTRAASTTAGITTADGGTTEEGTTEEADVTTVDDSAPFEPPLNYVITYIGRVAGNPPESQLMFSAVLDSSQVGTLALNASTN